MRIWFVHKDGYKAGAMFRLRLESQRRAGIFKRWWKRDGHLRFQKRLTRKHLIQ
jgi:hypothetical protein